MKNTFNNIFEDFLNNASNDFFNNLSNKYTIQNINNEYIIKIDLPGFDKSEIDIQCCANVTSYISVLAKSSSKDSTNLYSKEFQLPPNINLNTVYAKLKNGILTIVCEKNSNVTAPRKIEISE